MTDITVTLIIAIIVIAAITKIVIEKKKGARCVGCPTSPKGPSDKKNCGCE